MSDQLFALNLLAAVSFGIGVGVIAAAATIGPHLAVDEGVGDDDLWGWDAQALEGAIDRDGRRSERRVERRRRVVRRGDDGESRRERRSRRSYTAPILERDPFDTEDDRGGCDGYPSASPEPTAFPLVDGAREVPRAVLDWGLDNAAALGRSVRFAPRIGADGAFDGIALAEVPEGSLIGELGLESGDALLAVNGRALGGASVALGEWPLTRPDTIALEIERGGAQMTLRYRVVEGGADRADSASADGADSAAPTIIEGEGCALVTSDDPTWGEVLRLSEPGGASTGYSSSMRFAPWSDGEVEGFKISRLQSGSPPAQLGVQSGDVITGIAGLPLRGVEDLQAILPALHDTRCLRIDYVRDGAHGTRWIASQKPALLVERPR